MEGKITLIPRATRIFTALVLAILVGLLLKFEVRAQTNSCSMSASAVYKAASHAVVFIGTRKINPYKLNGRIERALGSGFIFEPRGLILTNSHVVFEAHSIIVILDDGSSLPAKLVAADPIFDLAIIQIKPLPGKTLTALPLAGSANLAVGDDVIAIGNPLGLEQTLTTGVVSGLNRVLPESPLSLTRQMIQTDAAINPGNSGGPLLDRCARVVGINTAIIPGAQNVGFAIPIDLIKTVLPSLLKNGRIIRPWVGFHGQLVNENLRQILSVPIVSGLLIEVVEPDSPAAKNGLRGGAFDISIGGNELLLGGDVITEMNGIRLDSPGSLRKAIGALAVGQQLSLKIWREGKVQSVRYKLPVRPLLPSDLPD